MWAPDADDRRPPHRAALELGALLDHDLPLDLGVHQLAVHPLLQVLEHQAVGLQHVLQAAGVLPPAAHDVRLHALAAVDQGVDRVGDLQLAAAEGSIDLAAAKISGPNM